LPGGETGDTLRIIRTRFPAARARRGLHVSDKPDDPTDHAQRPDDNKTPKDGERKFSREQYDMLLRCSKKRDMTEWNQWRKANPKEQICLEEAPLGRKNLRGANLRGAWLSDASLCRAKLHNADLSGAHLEHADLGFAELQDANLCKAHLEGARLREAHLEQARLWDAHLEYANPTMGYLHGAEIWNAHLEGADFRLASVDGATLICGITYDENTDFRGVALSNARLDGQLQPKLEGIARRLHWMEWYERHPFRRWPAKAFWAMSDYGRSTGRVIVCFFICALAFANVYLGFGVLRDVYGLTWIPQPVSNLFVEGGRQVPNYVVPIRALYFSIVTQTTLGFGDMFANAESVLGHVLLMVQVILGYVLLGALVTRLGILFTSR